MIQKIRKTIIFDHLSSLKGPEQTGPYVTHFTAVTRSYSYVRVFWINKFDRKQDRFNSAIKSFFKNIQGVNLALF